MTDFIQNFILTVVLAFALPVTPGPATGNYVTYDTIRGRPYNVSYDARSFIINGHRTLLLGGSLHYPRFSPGQWPGVLQSLKTDGLNHVEVYVFWNLHEKEYNQSGIHVYDFTGRADLAKFLKTAADVGLFVNLRIGPYVCAEWNFGGLPVWLKDIPGIIFRDYNQPWMDAMETFVRHVAKIAEPYLARNGGPIILAQIENEYWAPNSISSGQQYVDWCGNLTASLDFGIPWVMCNVCSCSNGLSANNTLNTCNGADCATAYAPYHEATWPDQPLAWTENWSGFQSWGSPASPDWRSPEVMANVVAKWFAVGAAHHNYYMYQGGNHVGAWAGSGITNMYADGSNYHADSLPNEPKRTHLQRLHAVLIQYNALLLETPKQFGKGIPLGSSDPPRGTVQPCNASDPRQQFILQWVPDNQSLSRIQWKGVDKCMQGDPSQQVEFVTCDNDMSQFFQWLPSGQIQSHGNSQCLDQNMTLSHPIDMSACEDPSTANSTNQKWVYSGNGQLVSLANQKCCTVEEGTTTAMAYVYGSGANTSSSLTFLTNFGTNGPMNVTWKSMTYTIFQDAVLLIDVNGAVLFDTASVNVTGVPTQRIYYPVYNFTSGLRWEYYAESGSYTDAFPHTAPLEQLSVTKDLTEYLVYEVRNVTFGADVLSVDTRMANALIVFVDGIKAGDCFDFAHNMGSLTKTIDIQGIETAPHRLTILSVSLGINNIIAIQQPPSAQDAKGIVGNISIGTRVLTHSNVWYHRPGLSGEMQKVYTKEGGSSVTWSHVQPSLPAQPLTWYRTRFDRPPAGAGVIVLDIGNSPMKATRGHFYLNGVDLGRYWGTQAGDPPVPVQRYYLLPEDILIDRNNLLVFVDELGDFDVIEVAIVQTYMQVPEDRKEQ